MRMAGGAALLLCVIGLAGCSGNDESAAASDATSSSDGPLSRDWYHDQVRSDVPELAERSDEDLDKIAAATCGVLKPGDTESWVLAVKALIDNDVGAKHAGSYIVYATATFCPEKLSALPDTGS